MSWAWFSRDEKNKSATAEQYTPVAVSGEARIKEMIEAYGQTIICTGECKAQLEAHEKCKSVNKLQDPRTDAEKSRIRSTCYTTYDALSQCVNDSNKWAKFLPLISTHPKCTNEAELVEECKERRRKQKYDDSASSKVTTTDDVELDQLVFDQLKCGLMSILEDTVESQKEISSVNGDNLRTIRDSRSK